MAALILTKDILIDNMNDLAFNWSDINSLRIEPVRGFGFSKIIRINLKERSKYLKLIKNPMIRILATIRLFDIFIIQTNLLEQRSEFVYESLIQFHQTKTE